MKTRVQQDAEIKNYEGICLEKQRTASLPIFGFPELKIGILTLSSGG
jgi:hypothetical protein